MKAFVAVTDNDWFDFLSRQRDIDEVNFWTPSGKPLKKFLPGEPVLFKLHAPDNYIVGGGFFASFSSLPADFAWSAFGNKNGAASLNQMHDRIQKHLQRKGWAPGRTYEVGCTILVEPFFLPRRLWIDPPPDFSTPIQRGKTYDLTVGLGARLWAQVLEARASAGAQVRERPEEGPEVEFAEMLVQRRLGQGAFKVMVTEAYSRRCAVTGTKTLPALHAAHIRPVSQQGRHSLDNGLLLRSDIHALFDSGYVTVAPDLTFHASPRLKEDFDNGEEYRRLQGTRIIVPTSKPERPSPELLEWHADTVFRR